MMLWNENNHNFSHAWEYVGLNLFQNRSFDAKKGNPLLKLSLSYCERWNLANLTDFTHSRKLQHSKTVIILFFGDDAYT